MTSPEQSSCWLDVKVVYARVSAPNIANSTLDCLLFACPPRGIVSELEVNGARIPPSDEAVLALRKDRIDTDSSEATFVSTDKLRLRSSLAFRVVHEGEQLVAGEISCKGKSPCGSDHAKTGWCQWVVDCTCTTSSSWSGFMVKSVQDLSDRAIQPSVEICIVGRADGAPVMLTETVQLTARRRNHWRGELDAIPEEGDKTPPLHLNGTLLAPETEVCKSFLTSFLLVALANTNITSYLAAGELGETSRPLFSCKV